MKDITKKTDEIMGCVRAAIKESAEAAARLETHAKLESELSDLNAKVAAAPDADIALSFVDPMAKLQAKLAVARIREPIERTAAGKASQAVDGVLSDAIQAFSQEFIEPLKTRLVNAADRFAFVCSCSPEVGMQYQGLPPKAWDYWNSAIVGVFSTADRVGCLEALIPLLPEAFERVELIEKAAAVLAPLDRR